VRSDARATFAGPAGVFGAVALLALGLLTIFSAAALAAPGHSLIRTISLGPNTNPRSVATDSAGNYYVAEVDGNRIEKFDAAGNPSPFSASTPYVEGNRLVGVPGGPFPEFQPWRSLAIAVDNSGGPNDGHIYLTVQREQGTSVLVYASSGVYVGRLGPAANSNQCTGVVNQANGSVYFGGDYLGALTRYPQPSGIIENASPNGELKVPPPGSGCAVAVDDTGAVYIGYYPIAKYPASQFGVASPIPSIVFSGDGANAMALDPVNGDVYADKGGEVTKWNAAGTQLGSNFGQLADSRGIAVTPSRNVAATDQGGGVFIFGREEVQLPTGTTGGSTNVELTTADVEGTSDPDGAGTITGCEFRFGEDTGYSEGSVPCTPAAPISSATPVSAHLTGLISGAFYHYRLFLTNAAGTQMSTGDRTLTTTPATAEVSALPATAVEKDSAVLHGSYTGGGQDVHYFFEWGRTNGYGHATPGPPGADAGAGTGTQNLPPVQISGLSGGSPYHYRLVVSTPSGITRSPDQTFTTAPAVGNLTVEKPTVVTETTADLRASFEGDSTYATSYYFEWGQTTSYGNTTPAPPGNSVPAGEGHIEFPPVPISGLQKGAVYHFRIVASNETGTTISADQTFRTADAPLVGNVNSRNVKATSAELTGEINPRYGETTYVFEWGTSGGYGNSVPVPAGNVGSGDLAVPVNVQLERLSSDVTYHFRLVATNQYGSTASPDQVFGFYPPSCPNSQVRQEVRANAVPDCRAYELVSPTYAQGAALMPFSGPTSGVATSPPRLIYSASWGNFDETTGEPTSGFSDKYVSTRTSTGWTTRYVGIPADQGVFTSGPPGAIMGIPQFGDYPAFQRGTQATPNLARVIDYATGFPGQGENPGSPSNAPYVWDSITGKQVDRWPSGVAPEDLDFVGMPQASSDFTHFVFSSNLVFAEGGQPSSKEIGYGGGFTAEQVWPEDYVYDNDTETGSIVLASVKSAAKGNEPFQGRAFNVSQDGSHILMTDEASLDGSGMSIPPDPRQIAIGSEAVGPFYLRVDGRETVEFGAGHKLIYEGSSPDGETVYLASSEQLSPDDHDSSIDIFVWRESDPGSFTRISIGDHGEAGNTDDCSPNEQWIALCGAFVPGINIGYALDGAGNGITDNFRATETDDFYFESPEQLQGQRGDPGERNLYLYRNGAVRFVATMKPNADASRMQVTPDGAHMALVTKSDLTDYHSGGHKEMFVYDPRAGSMACASCRPDAKTPTDELRTSGNGLFLTNDGRVFFTTRDPLVARDTNEQEDVYEFTEGKAQLITTGLGPGFPTKVVSSITSPGLIGVSAEGTDVYFATIDNLVTQDHNGAQVKVYDARVGGGFPAERENPKCVAADECHGPSSSQSLLPPDRTSAHIGATGKAKPSKGKGKKNKAKKHGKSKKHNKKKRGKRHG
jgi:hypothetical protein